MKKITILLTAIIMTTLFCNAQEDIEVTEEKVAYAEYEFDTIFNIDVTTVKNQARSGTCWSFAAVSFIEAELLRKTGKEYDLSEIYFVRQAYLARADRYIRRHGKSNFGPGGQAHDVIDILKLTGCLPETSYSGLNTGSTIHNHAEIDPLLKAYLDVIRKQKFGTLNTNWRDGFSALLDVYLDTLAGVYNIDDSDITPAGYANSLELNPDDYIELTSFLHHPWYSSFVLEIPDNWSDGLYYNIKMDEMLEAVDYALEKGYTVAWDGDVSNIGFQFFNSIAVVPGESLAGLDRSEIKERLKYMIDEKEITQEYRQEQFDKLIMTDDHLMHLTGMVKDQNGNKYYIIKNSWGEKSNTSGGYLLISENYFRLNTIAVMVNKDSLPKSIRKALNL